VSGREGLGDSGEGSGDSRPMTRWRVSRSIIAWGWRAAPGWTIYTGALLTAGAVCSVLYPVGFALIIDAALRHQLDLLVLGVAGVASCSP
jgi:hypothetical protein